MRAIATAMSFATLMLALGASAQNTAQVQVVNATHPVAEASSPDYTATYCSGFITDEKVPTEVRVMSGEETGSKIVFASGDSSTSIAARSRAFASATASPSSARTRIPTKFTGSNGRKNF